MPTPEEWIEDGFKIGYVSAIKEVTALCLSLHKDLKDADAVASDTLATLCSTLRGRLFTPPTFAEVAAMSGAAAAAAAKEEG